LRQHKPKNAHSLFALTGLSNISNAKNPLSILKFASSLGYNTLLDAAALAPSSVISLSETPVDAMAVSFYKMFGYPTGVGALIVKESFLKTLERPWFAGGTVDVVQVPGSIVTRASSLHEQFEVCFFHSSYLASIYRRFRMEPSILWRYQRSPVVYDFSLHIFRIFLCASHVLPTTLLPRSPI